MNKIIRIKEASILDIFAIFKENNFSEDAKFIFCETHFEKIGLNFYSFESILGSVTIDISDKLILVNWLENRLQFALYAVKYNHFLPIENGINPIRQIFYLTEDYNYSFKIEYSDKADLDVESKNLVKKEFFL